MHTGKLLWVDEREIDIFVGRERVYEGRFSV